MAANINARHLTAGAKLLQGNYDKDSIHDKMDGVPFAIHREFDSRSEAFLFYQLYYPHTEKEEDIAEMNNNTPLETSNLNNPPPKLRNSFRGVDCSNKTEVIYIDDLEPAILELRQGASRRMWGQNRALHESYDFKLPGPQGLVIIAPQQH